jgi:hypothetical protein
MNLPASAGSYSVPVLTKGIGNCNIMAKCGHLIMAKCGPLSVHKSRLSRQGAIYADDDPLWSSGLLRLLLGRQFFKPRKECRSVQELHNHFGPVRSSPWAVQKSGV